MHCSSVACHFVLTMIPRRNPLPPDERKDAEKPREGARIDGPEILLLLHAASHLVSCFDARCRCGTDP